MEGERKAGAAVVDGKDIIWASALPPGTSAQRAELIALTQVLKKAEGKKANIYTDSRYAFATAHVHGEIYRRRGLLTSEGKEIKNKYEILDLFQGLFLPKKLSAIAQAIKMGTQGNHLADETAKIAALGPQILTVSFESTSKKDDLSSPTYDMDLDIIQKLGEDYDKTCNNGNTRARQMPQVLTRNF